MGCFHRNSKVLDQICSIGYTTTDASTCSNYLTIGTSAVSCSTTSALVGCQRIAPITLAYSRMRCLFIAIPHSYACADIFFHMSVKLLRKKFPHMSNSASYCYLMLMKYIAPVMLCSPLFDAISL